MLMILAGAIFACLIGIIYLLWNLRTLQKQIDNVENSVTMIETSGGRGGPAAMPSLEEVIAHYEKQLGPEDEEETGEVEEAGEVETPSDSVEEDTSATLETIVEETESDVESNTKVIEFGSHSQSVETDVDMSKFNSILVKDLRDLCRKLGFSPKGNKKTLVSRLLNHPKYENEDGLATEFNSTETESAEIKDESVSNKEVSTTVVEMSDETIAD